MQKNDERMVLFFDMKISTYASMGRQGKLAGLQALPIDQLFQLVDQMRLQQLLSRSNRKHTETMYLADMDLDKRKGYLTLLINRSDRQASDYVLSDPPKSKRRVIAKNAGEGADFSGHLVIRLASAGPDTYRAALEVSPGLPSSKIALFLNHLLRLCDLANPTQFHRPHPDGSRDKDGNPRVVKARHKIELRGHPSNTFLKDLESGTISGIELINGRHRNHAWDSNGYIVEQSREVHLKPNAKQIAGKIYDTVKSVCGVANNKHYELMRIKFTTLTGVNRSVDLETDSAQVADDERYIKKETIRNFPTPLPASFAAISPDIRDRIRVLLL